MVTTAEDVLITEDDSIYRKFVDQPRSSSRIDRIPVILEFADPELDPAWPVFFESGETWQALRDGEETILAFRSPIDEDRYWWLARLGGDPDTVRLIFAPELLDQTADGRSISNPLRYPVDQILTMMILSRKQGCIIHAAGVARDGRGVACIGRSGAGKTTFMGLMPSDEDTVRLSDDRLVARLVQGQPVLFGTPWAGEGLVAADQSASFSAIVFLHQAPENRLERIDAAAAAHQLFPTTSIPWFDEKLMAGCLDTIDTLVRIVPAYNLHFRNEPGAAEVIQELFEKPLP